jgi:UDP-N-acetyl-D-mannosaminuronic acid transferase (WecB/TagA/CpsF family)
MITHEIPDAKTALDHADMVAADGMPIVWLQRRRGFDEAERCYGAGLMRSIFREDCGHGSTTLFVVVAIQAYRMCWSKSYAGNMVKLTLSGDILPL